MMNTQQLVDQIVIARANGSEGLVRTATFIEAILRRESPEVVVQTFTATPYGFQLVFAAALVLMVGFAVVVAVGRHALALFLVVLAVAVLLVEFEWLWSPLSGLVSASERNIAAVFPGRPRGPTLVFSAHYDTATQFGDHHIWSIWAALMVPAGLIALALPVAGLARRRRGRELGPRVTVPATVLSLTPFLAMAWFFSAGPILRAPSPGAVDNGGSVVTLLRLAERLAVRSADTPTTVQLVFLAAEEERALGSWHYAATLEAGSPVAIVNLETIGASDRIAYVPEERFPLGSYQPAEALVRLINDAARRVQGKPILAVPLPPTVITDARSFLRRGLDAVTLFGLADGSWPRRLHSEWDSRDRLSLPALERAVDLLAAIVAEVDRDPSRIGGGAGR